MSVFKTFYRCGTGLQAYFNHSVSPYFQQTVYKQKCITDTKVLSQTNKSYKNIIYF